MPNDLDPERRRSAARAAVIDTLMAAPIAQRAAVVGVIKFAQHARLSLEDLVYAVDQLEPAGGGVAEHMDRVVKGFRRGMRDSNVELRRRQIRSVPTKKELKLK